MTLVGTDFNTALENEAENDFDQLGAETVTYTPAGGSPVSISAVVFREKMTYDFDDTDRGVEHIYSVAVAAKLADVAAPGKLDKWQFPFVSGGSNLTWSVASIDDTSCGRVRLMCETRSDKELAGRPLRRST